MGFNSMTYGYNKRELIIASSPRPNCEVRNAYPTPAGRPARVKAKIIKYIPRTVALSFWRSIL